MTSHSEPVAVVSGYHGGQCVIVPTNPSQILNPNTALYTSPPKREWQGLTYDDLPDQYKSDSVFVTGWLWAEQKLKEKNA